MRKQMRGNGHGSGGRSKPALCVRPHRSLRLRRAPPRSAHGTSHGRGKCAATDPRSPRSQASAATPHANLRQGPHRTGKQPASCPRGAHRVCSRQAWAEVHERSRVVRTTWRMRASAPVTASHRAPRSRGRVALASCTRTAQARSSHSAQGPGRIRPWPASALAGRTRRRGVLPCARGGRVGQVPGQRGPRSTRKGSGQTSIAARPF